MEKYTTTVMIKRGILPGILPVDNVGFGNLALKTKEESW